MSIALTPSRPRIRASGWTAPTWAATHEGVRCCDPDGTLIGKLLLPDVVSNLTFGGAKGNRLFVTATTSVWSWLTTANGAQR